MREIKFRAWHNGDEHFNIKPHMIYDENPGDCLVWKCQGQNIKAIMQFAGVKDKNGVEIYEGDIWKSRNGVMYIVVWHQKWVGYALFCPESEMHYGIPVDELKMGEVIGNIYENPGLLSHISQNMI